jgi:hypothetical protein
MKNRTLLMGIIGAALLAGMMITACTTLEYTASPEAPADSASSTPAAVAPEADAPVSQVKKELQDIYLNYLRYEGYVPEIDSDGDVMFKVSGNTYYIIVNEDDEEYFRMYTQRTLSSSQRSKAHDAANYATRRTKVAKVYVSQAEDRVTIAAEIYVARPEDFKDVFSRLISAIETAEEYFTDQLNS